MVKYECYRCGYTTDNKSNIIRHIERKKSCKPIISNINLDDYKSYILKGISCEIYTKYPQNNVDNHKITHLCTYCNKTYSRIDSLNRHLKTCKEKKKDDTVKESMESLVKILNEQSIQIEKFKREQEKQINDFKKEILRKDKEIVKKDRNLEKELRIKEKEYQSQIKEQNKQIKELIKKAGIYNNGNVTNNIQNNFKLLNYKETDTSHLTENDYIKCLEHYNFCVPHLIRKIHFNPKKPENHNIYISNLKNSYVMIYMNNKWKVKNRDETISRIIDEKQILFEKKIQEWVESGIQYPKVMAKFSRYIEKREQNDVINAIKEDIKLILYNNRNMIIENNKKLIK